LAPEAARFKNELHFHTLQGVFEGSVRKGQAFLFRYHGVGRILMSGEILPLMASKRVRPKLLAVRTAGAGLVALLMLALLAFAQAEISASSVATAGSPSISSARQGDAVALLRVTGKAQALEARAGRPLAAKLVSGNPGALLPASVFFILCTASSVKTAVVLAFAAAPQSHANQPRAPPTV